MKVLLHTHSVMSFLLALTALGMLVHLLRLKQPVKAKGWLTCFYLGLSIWQFENVVRYSMPLEYIGSTAYILQVIFILIPALSLTLISHTQYVYHFLVSTFERERRIVLRASLFLAACELSFVVWNELYNGSNSDLMRLSAFIFSFLFTIWIITLALRKAIYLRKMNNGTSKAHFIYAGINACYVGGSICSIIFGFFSIPGYWSYFLLIWLGNLASIVLYIVSAAVPVGFQTKVTGFTYVLAATILSLITLLFYPPVFLTNEAEQVAQQSGLINLMIIITLVALMIVVLMPFMLKISLTRRLQRLLDGVQQVNAGNLDTQVPVGLFDEIGLLAQNFNQMTQNLKKAQDDLTEYAQNLEKKVARRTAQLQQSLNELKATQAQLIQSEKMASLGELTAGIAHEIKNPLNFINNFSELSEELCQELIEEIKREKMDRENMSDLAEDIAKNLEKIHHHGNRAGAIVTSMLEHSRISRGEKQLTDINELVEEYLNASYESMILKDKSFDAVLVTHLDPAIEKINLIPQDLGRVLFNLFNNSFYSLCEKKKLLDGTFEPTVSVSTKVKKDKIEIRVRDNGIGIPDRIVNKIYQPFFTTKPAGEGTGLGLSLSYDIITKGYGGEMKVQSEEGKYAEFIITLPYVPVAETQPAVV